MLEYFARVTLGVVFAFLVTVNIAFVPASHWWKTFLGFFQFSGLPQPNRLGADRGAGCHRGLGRDREPHGDEPGARLLARADQTGPGGPGTTYQTRHRFSRVE